jgi:hypothetical protein
MQKVEGSSPFIRFTKAPLMRPDPTNPAWLRWKEAPDSWWLRLGLHGLEVDRQFLPPSHWTLRLVVGADEADARFYELNLSWAADAPDAESVLGSVLTNIKELSAEAFGALPGHD